MRALPDTSCGSIDVDITGGFRVDLYSLRHGIARQIDDDNDEAFPQCDASGEDEEALEAAFFEKAETGDRRVGVIRARVTPDGFRQFIHDVRSAARASCGWIGARRRSAEQFSHKAPQAPVTADLRVTY